MLQLCWINYLILLENSDSTLERSFHQLPCRPICTQRLLGCARRFLSCIHRPPDRCYVLTGVILIKKILYQGLRTTIDILNPGNSQWYSNCSFFWHFPQSWLSSIHSCFSVLSTTWLINKTKLSVFWYSWKGWHCQKMLHKCNLFSKETIHFTIFCERVHVLRPTCLWSKTMNSYRPLRLVSPITYCAFRNLFSDIYDKWSSNPYVTSSSF